MEKKNLIRKIQVAREEQGLSKAEAVATTKGYMKREIPELLDLLQSAMTEPINTDILPGDVRFHPWEEAGLGRAPFRFIEMHELPGRQRVQCGLCKEWIKIYYVIHSHENREFLADKDCIDKLSGPEPDIATLKEAVRDATISHLACSPGGRELLGSLLKKMGKFGKQKKSRKNAR